MKFVMDERVKHRLVGLIVILSLAAIFLPAVMKKSNQRFEENVSVSVHLPAKPPLPKVAVASEKALFKTVKVAHVNIQSVNADSQLTQIVKAEPISIKPAVLPAPAVPNTSMASTIEAPVAKSVATATLHKQPLLDSAKHTAPVVSPPSSLAMNKKPGLAKSEPSAPPSGKSAVVAKKLTHYNTGGNREAYAVQLASFLQQNNAVSLVSKLRDKGFKASYNKVPGKQGSYYKVIVGQLKQIDEAKSLQKQILASTKLQGLIVKTGVS